MLNWSEVGYVDEKDQDKDMVFSIGNLVKYIHTNFNLKQHFKPPIVGR